MMERVIFFGNYKNESNTSPDKEGKYLSDLFQEKLAKFLREIDAQIEKEFPYLAEDNT